MRRPVQRLVCRAAIIAVALVSPACATNVSQANAADDEVLALGDSVMLGAQSCLEAVGITVDAKGNRRIDAGIKVLSSMGSRAPEQIVVHLGTNGGLQPGDLDRLMAVAGPDRRITVLTIQLPDDPSRYTFEERTNANIARLPHRYPNAFVLDWNRLTTKNPDLVGGDSIHLTRAGCTGYAAMVKDHVGS